jgi:hypothetical protein
LNNEALKHRNPPTIDRSLSESARRNLTRHYKKDLEIYQTCLLLREGILKKPRSQDVTIAS